MGASSKYRASGLCVVFPPRDQESQTPPTGVPGPLHLSHIPGGAATGLLGFGFELQLWVSTWGDFAPQPHGIQHRLQTFWVVTAGGQGDVPDIYQVVTRDDAT